MREELSISFLLRLFLAVLMLIVFTAVLLLRPMKYRLAALEAETGTARAGLEADGLRIDRMEELRRKLASLPSEVIDPLAPPEHLSATMIWLDSCLAPVPGYTLSFSPPEELDYAICRRVRVDFAARSYEAAEEVIAGLFRYEYRFALGDLVCTAIGSDLTGPVNVTLEAVFWEELP